MEERFLQLLDEHQGILHKVCRLYRDTEVDREDLFQEIVYHLWKAFPAFEGRSKVSTWIYRIALNTALVRFRKPRPKISFQAELPQWPIESSAVKEVESERLLWAIRQLKEVDRALLSLYLDDLTYEQMGQIIGITPSNVGARLNRIKNKLKSHLKAK